MSCFRFLFAAGLAFLAGPTSAEGLRVVADTPIAHSMAALVMEGVATPDLLLGQGADPHDFQLRPSQARALAQADLVLWTSPALSPWMARPIGSLSSGALLTLSAVEGVRHQGFGENPRLDAGHEDGHDHGADDPHLWLDPGNALPWLHAIATELAALDPGNADRYAANAARAIVRVQETAAEVARILAPVGDAGLVMYHDAYGYFATAFGLNILATVTRGDAADPGAARISALRQTLESTGTVCLFPEVNHPAALAMLVAEGTALRIGAPLDPEGVSLAPGPDLYAQTLLGLARAIAECVEGP